VQSLSFQLLINVRPAFLQSSTKTTYHNKLNAEAAVRKQLSSIKSETEEICKDVKQCHFLKILEIYSFFVFS